MFGLGVGEAVAILLVILVLFGGRKLPEIGTGLGLGIKNFRKAYREAKAIDITGAGEDSASSEQHAPKNS